MTIQLMLLNLMLKQQVLIQVLLKTLHYQKKQQLLQEDLFLNKLHQLLNLECLQQKRQQITEQKIKV